MVSDLKLIMLYQANQSLRLTAIAVRMSHVGVRHRLLLCERLLGKPILNRAKGRRERWFPDGLAVPSR